MTTPLAPGVAMEKHTANPLLNFPGHSGSRVDVWLKPQTSALPVSTALRRDLLLHWDHKLLGLCEARAPKGLISLYLGRPGWRKEEVQRELPGHI